MGNEYAGAKNDTPFKILFFKIYMQNKSFENLLHDWS